MKYTQMVISAPNVWIKGHISPWSMYPVSYLTVDILTVKGKYDSHKYFKGKYEPQNTSGVYMIFDAYFMGKYDP